MPISPKCPHCDARETYPDSDAGRTVNCSACGGAIALPAKARPVAAAVAVAKAKPIAAAVVAAPIVVAKPESQPEFQFDDVEEPKPRKKSKPTVDLDEDEPSFRKKPRRQVEDEDDDDSSRRQPGKKGGGKKLLLILGGIAFVLLAVCSGVGIYLYIQADKAVADIQSKFTDTRFTAKTTADTKPADGRPRVKENVARVDRLDTFASVSTKMGLGSDAMILDLEEMLTTFQEGGGQTKSDLQIVLDAYAPWVDKGRGIVFWDGANFRALLVFSGPATDRRSWKIHGVLTVEQTGNRTLYNEQIGLAKVTAGDPEAVKLNLKGWKNFKPDEGRGAEPPVGDPGPKGFKITSEELVAEVLKDRAAASKKYGGQQLEVTGEIKVRSSAGSTLYLKGALDENTMKDVTVAFTMKVDEREAARKCQVGDTVTLTGMFPATLQLTAPTVPLREGAIKK